MKRSPATVDALWVAASTIPGADALRSRRRPMTEIGPRYLQVDMQLRVAAVGDRSRRDIAVRKQAPEDLQHQGFLAQARSVTATVPARFEIASDGEKGRAADPNKGTAKSAA